jgi:hypothetical protein
MVKRALLDMRSIQNILDTNIHFQRAVALFLKGWPVKYTFWVDRSIMPPVVQVIHFQILWHW